MKEFYATIEQFENKVHMFRCNFFFGMVLIFDAKKDDKKIDNVLLNLNDFFREK